MGKIFGSESKRSIRLVSMSTVKKKMGPYWEDVRPSGKSPSSNFIFIHFVFSFFI